MNIIAAIPARYEASRFPGKLMEDLDGKTVIRRVYEAAKNAGLFNEVYVVTDSDEIEEEIQKLGGLVLRSKKEHESGSDRIAEAIVDMDVDVIVNVQGDTPFITAAPLKKLVDLFEDPKVEVASLMQKITEKLVIEDPNRVKVCVDKNFNSLLFSRSVIPFPRNEKSEISYFEHVGVYAYRKETLMQFTEWPMTPLEEAEKIECLRYLENGVPLRMAITDYIGISIDAPLDLEEARRFIRKTNS